MMPKSSLSKNTGEVLWLKDKPRKTRLELRQRLQLLLKLLKKKKPDLRLSRLLSLRRKLNRRKELKKRQKDRERSK